MDGVDGGNRLFLFLSGIEVVRLASPFRGTARKHQWRGGFLVGEADVRWTEKELNGGPKAGMRFRAIDFIGESLAEVAAI